MLPGTKDSHQILLAKHHCKSYRLIRTLRKHHPELRLCADNWKAMKLMIDNYSQLQWFNYHVKKKNWKTHQG
jgi:hypothetical protein